MPLSGSRIASTAITMAHRRMVRPGSKAATAHTISTAAVPGTSLRTVSAPRSETRAPPDSGSTISASGLAGRLLHLESLRRQAPPICLERAPRDGQAGFLLHCMSPVMGDKRTRYTHFEFCRTRSGHYEGSLSAAKGQTEPQFTKLLPDRD